MTGLLALAGVVIVLLMNGWWLSWLATRLDRAHHRVERSWATLDAALVRRAQRATEVARGIDVDPATTLLVCDAAAAALEVDLPRDAREQVESTLSHVLDLVELPGVELEQDRAILARRLHNDAVSTARSLRRRPVVRIFGLAGRAPEPKPFEMADDQQLLWPGGEQR
jgi:hypothetical protein